MNTIQLIGVGTVEAIPASEVKVGDERLYNYYGTGLVIKIIEKSAKTLTFITHENGNYYMFDVRKTTLIAINRSGLDVSMHTPKEAKHRKLGMVDVSEYFPVVEESVAMDEVAVSLEEAITELDSEVEQVKEMESDNTDKVEIESVTFEWSESNLIKEDTVLHTMAEAEMLVYRIACSIEENDGYCNKTGFLIKWTDGETYRGRIDITVSDKRLATPLRDHVLAHCNFFAGNQPSHMNESDYQSMLRAYKVTEEDMQEYRDFMNKYLLEDVKKEEVNAAPVEHTPESNITEDQVTNEQETKLNNIVTIHNNEERNSVELFFSSKPDEDTRSLLKAHKFRWSRYNSVWWKQNPTESDYSMINRLTNSEISYNNEAPETRPNFDYLEIDIHDIESYTVPQDIQDREHETGWIFRGDKVDHTKQLQEHFTEYNNKAIELLQTTDNGKISYELKKSLQYFKKHYHEAYIKYLSAKAAQPSWAITGRSGLNVSRYNKNMSRIDSHMHKLNELQEDYEKRFNKAKKEIMKDEQRKITEAVQGTDINITFKMKKKEFTYMGITENRKVHCYEDYWIAKTWGCFRIFKGNKELHACKTKETLDHAIKYAIYHMQKENKKAV